MVESDIYGATAVPAVGDGGGNTGLEICSVTDPALAAGMKEWGPDVVR